MAAGREGSRPEGEDAAGEFQRQAEKSLPERDPGRRNGEGEQRRRDRLGVSGTRGRVALKELGDQVAQRRGNVLSERRRGRRRDRGGTSAGEHVVERGAERVEIGARVALR